MKNSDKRSTEWVKRLPEVVSALNNEVTRLIGEKTCRGNKREISFIQTRHALFDASWFKREKALSLSQCEISVLVN